MNLIIISLGILVFSGLVCLLAGGRLRHAPAVAAAGVVAGSGLAMIPVCRVLVHGEAVTVAAAWPLPLGRLVLHLDPLAAFFLVPVLLLSALAAVYGVSYLRHAPAHKAAAAG